MNRYDTGFLPNKRNGVSVYAIAVDYYSGLCKNGSHIFVILKSSRPSDFFPSRTRMIFNMSWLLKTIDLSVSLVTKEGWVEQLLSLSIGIHWRQKNSLNISAFFFLTLKSDTSLLFIGKCGITSIFLTLASVFSMNQYVFSLVWGLFTLVASLKGYSFFFWAVYSENTKIILFM